MFSKDGPNARVMMLNAHIAMQKHTMFRTLRKMKVPSGPFKSRNDKRAK